MSAPDQDPERRRQAASDRRFYGWFSVTIVGLFLGVTAFIASGWLAIFFDPV